MNGKTSWGASAELEIGKVQTSCQDRSRLLLLSVIASCFLSLASSRQGFAQEIPAPAYDSLQLERLVQLYGPGDFVSNARRAVVARLRDGDHATVSSILFFMPNRQGVGEWLSPEEELMVRTLTTDLAFIRNEIELTTLLIARVNRPGAKTVHNDNLLYTLRGWLRSDPGSLRHSMQSKGADDIEVQFFQVLLNAQQVTSVGKVRDVNREVDRFVEANATSAYAPIADRYLRLQRSPARLGAAFFLGYEYGGIVGSSSGIPGRSNGPTIGGDIFIDRWTATGELTIGHVGVRDSFSVGGRSWQSGDAVLLGGTLGVGYELRAHDALVTPFAGGSFFALQEDAAEGDRREEQTTGVQAGIALGTIVTYRIPFDHGPHLDLRTRVSAIFPGFSRYSPDLDGVLILVGVSFGFVGRPYRVEPAMTARE